MHLEVNLHLHKYATHVVNTQWLECVVGVYGCVYMCIYVYMRTLTVVLENEIPAEAGWMVMRKPRGAR